MQQGIARETPERKDTCHGDISCCFMGRKRILFYYDNGCF
jgi:hypothetical protein